VTDNPIDSVTTLTFDIFGTVLDLAGSLVPPVSQFLADHSAAIGGEAFWAQWRTRQRIEQYQDNILMLGHSGYLETCRRAFVYTLQSNEVEFAQGDVDDFMAAYQHLLPYEDAIEGLKRLAPRFKLVALSNGEQGYLEHLVANQIKVDFDSVISVQHSGVFKPHPAVYRTAARMLKLEPAQIMMVAAHSFDILGARACGFRGAYVDRYGLPLEDAAKPADLNVRDFIELSDRLLANNKR
jgi:2-haloacid dehalogenase